VQARPVTRFGQAYPDVDLVFVAIREHGQRAKEAVVYEPRDPAR
jgi:hypothetical protein